MKKYEMIQSLYKIRQNRYNIFPYSLLKPNKTNDKSSNPTKWWVFSLLTNTSNPTYPYSQTLQIQLNPTKNLGVQSHLIKYIQTRVSLHLSEECWECWEVKTRDGWGSQGKAAVLVMLCRNRCRGCINVA